jgi:hypothetical protein
MKRTSNETKALLGGGGDKGKADRSVSESDRIIVVVALVGLVLRGSRSYCPLDGTSRRRGKTVLPYP